MDEIKNPNSPEGRRALAKMTLSLFRLWQLDQADQFSILDLTLKAFESFQNGVIPTATWPRMTLLLEIHALLRTLFPENLELAYRWIRLPNRALHNKTPLEVMRSEGLTGLARIAEHLRDPLQGNLA